MLRMMTLSVRLKSKQIVIVTRVKYNLCRLHHEMLAYEFLKNAIKHPSPLGSKHPESLAGDM